ncbi:MAG: hypothetical protein AB2L14_13225 [Candidatus Xenobiia bacterium LiM19]
MAIEYPEAIDTWSSKTDGVDTIMASHINLLQDSVYAIETELGILPLHEMIHIMGFKHGEGAHCRRESHWCAWMRLGRHSTAKEPPEGYCVEKECFGSLQ